MLEIKGKRLMGCFCVGSDCLRRTFSTSFGLALPFVDTQLKGFFGALRQLLGSTAYTLLPLGGRFHGQLGVPRVHSPQLGTLMVFYHACVSTVSDLFPNHVCRASLFVGDSTGSSVASISNRIGRLPAWTAFV
jgi:hypothetical protein